MSIANGHERGNASIVSLSRDNDTRIGNGTAQVDASIGNESARFNVIIDNRNGKVNASIDY